MDPTEPNDFMDGFSCSDSFEDMQTDDTMQNLESIEEVAREDSERTRSAQRGATKPKRTRPPSTRATGSGRRRSSNPPQSATSPTDETVPEDQFFFEPRDIEQEDFSVNIASLFTDIDPTETFRTPAKAWTRRGEHAQENWSMVRPILAAGMVAAEAPPALSNVSCTRCGSNTAVVRCKTCVLPEETGHVLLCPGCDKILHPTAHFHQREVWYRGFYEAIPAQREFAVDGMPEYNGKSFSIRPARCNGCHLENTFTGGKEITHSPLKYIKHGVHFFVKASFQCANCRHVQVQGRDEFLRLGAWPATPVAEDCVIDISLLTRWRRHKYYGSPVSLESFLKEIEEERVEFGSEGSINVQNFRRAYSEYIFCTAESRHTYALFEDLACPSCGPNPASVHFDGNCKLFTRNRNYEGWRPSYYEESAGSKLKPFIRDDESVIEFVRMCDIATKNNSQIAEHPDCGGRTWKAGADSGKAPPQKYYTGRIFGVCKHTVALAATNMIQTGEKYGYALYLMVHDFIPKGLKFVHIDINCMHTKWRSLTIKAVKESVHPEVLGGAARMIVADSQEANETLTPLVSEMHSKLHDVWCQILFSPAYCPFTDKTTGEETEQFNARSSTWTTTRNMGADASTEEITDNTMFHNRIKLDSQAKTLWNRNIKTTRRLVEDKASLLKLTEELSGKHPETDLSFERCYSDLRAVAKDQYEKLRRPKKDTLEVEYLKLSQAIADGKALEEHFLNRASNPLRIMLDDSASRLSTVLQEHAKVLVDKLPVMKARILLVKASLDLGGMETLSAKREEEIKIVASQEALEKLQDEMEANSRIYTRHQDTLNT